MKRCPKCGEEKSLDEFHQDKRRLDGRHSECKICRNKLSAQNRKTRQARLGTIEVHSKYCPVCKRKLLASEFHSCVGMKDGLQSYCITCKRGHYLENEFGINLREYQEMVKSQDYKCAICGTTNSKTYSRNYFCVDHDHATRKIRGLLCNNCNTGIGLLGDDIERLEAAAAYLRKHKHGNEEDN